MDLTVQGLSLTAAQWGALSLNRKQLRQQLRHQRQSLSAQQQRHAAQQLSRVLLASPYLLRAKHIAVYLAGDGEIDPILFAQHAAKRGKRIYLPSLHPIRKGHLWFGDINAKRSRNRFGIWEPAPRWTTMKHAHQLDLVLMPLVGFDLTGARLGMGGGFYDRTFAYKQSQPNTKPTLIGLAHSLQQVPSLPVEPWDVPVSAIATEQQLHLIPLPALKI